jgi:exodeoxyribonuclease VII large subunit
MKSASFLIQTVLEDKIFSVSEFLTFLNSILKPCRAIVQGEVGERVANYPNYTFFNILDKDKSVLKCFAFASVIRNLNIGLKPGMEIRVIGYPQIRASRGELKFQVEKIELVGEGLLKKQFELTKRKLGALGFFNEEYKKPIPRFCENIGLITSKYGKGAKKDFLTRLGNFGFNIYFYDVRVEGAFSLYEITSAIEWFNKNLPQLDVIVITRGGGDWESLQPFNTEEVVRTIFSSKIPIITGIGHEHDETLADLAADFRASTPTHAAKILRDNWEIASKNIFEFERNIASSVKKIFEGVGGRITFFEKSISSRVKQIFTFYLKQLNDLERELNFNFQNYLKEFKILEKEFRKNFLKIKQLIKSEKEKLSNSSAELNKNQKNWLKKIEKLLSEEEKKLKLSNPELKLKQGYTITFDEKGRIIKNPSLLKISQKIKTKFHKGQTISEIKKIEK